MGITLELKIAASSSETCSTKMAKKRMTSKQVLEELFRDEASGGEDSDSESSSELSDDSEQMSDATEEAALSSENPDDSGTSCSVR